MRGRGLCNDPVLRWAVPGESFPLAALTFTRASAYVLVLAAAVQLLDFMIFTFHILPQPYMKSLHAPFGNQITFCEPSWYQGQYSPYYHQGHVAYRAKCRAFVETGMDL